MSKLWERISEARLIRVVLVYLGASWAILEATAMMRDEAHLPSWVVPLAAILLLVGLVIITTTAWIQAHPLTRRHADELPAPWEVDLVDLKRSVTKGQLPHLTWARAILGGVFAFSLLFGFAGLYVLLTGRAPSVPGPKEAVAAAAPSIAVLPFRTVGANLELWREGLVDLLATNLDGAAGFRTSDPRTLLNRWRREVGDALEPDREVALAIAEGVGADYAVMGSAVSLGSDVRVTAEVYDLETGAAIGRAQVEGPSDDVLTLVDRLSIALLEQIVALAPGDLPQFDVREVTTNSLEALKAYLAGEQEFRRGRWDEAAAHYTRAIDEDTTFALALFRIAQAYGWTEGFSQRVREFSERAARHADRLPPRAAMLVRADAEMIAQQRSSIESLEEMTRRYPDDPAGWHLLGEATYHLGDHAFRHDDEFRRAFTRAIELDASYSPAYIHLIEDAFARRDSASVKRYLDAYSQLSPASDEAVASRLLLDLAWGDVAAQEEARVAIDTLPFHTLADAGRSARWGGAYPWDVSRTITEELTDERFDEGERTLGHRYAYWETLQRGELAAAQEALLGLMSGLGNAPVLSENLAPMWLIVQGYPIQPPEQVELPSTPDDFTRFAEATYAAQAGRFETLEAAIAFYEEQAEERAAKGDEPASQRALSWAHLLRNYAAAVSGDVEVADEEYQKPLAGLPGWATGTVRFAIGMAYLEAGKPTEAVRYLRTFNRYIEAHVPSLYYLGETYEALGDVEKARLNYAAFVRWWENADPELQPWVERARQSLERLTAESGA